MKEQIHILEINFSCILLTSNQKQIKEINSSEIDSVFLVKAVRRDKHKITPNCSVQPSSQA